MATKKTDFVLKYYIIFIAKRPKNKVEKLCRIKYRCTAHPVHHGTTHIPHRKWINSWKPEKFVKWKSMSERARVCGKWGNGANILRNTHSFENDKKKKKLASLRYYRYEFVWIKCTFANYCVCVCSCSCFVRIFKWQNSERAPGQPHKWTKLNRMEECKSGRG